MANYDFIKVAKLVTVTCSQCEWEDELLVTNTLTVPLKQKTWRLFRQRGWRLKKGCVICPECNDTTSF